mgnify:CR=1 FL=1
MKRCRALNLFFMPKLTNILIAVLVLGIAYAELLPNLNSTTSQAFSAEEATPTKSELLLAFFDPANKTDVAIVAPANSVIFVNDISDVPGKLIAVAASAPAPLIVDYTTATAPLPVSPTTNEVPAAIIYTPAVPVTDQPFVGDVIPPYGTPLFNAYANGGRAWYQENDNVVVIFPDTETFQSFKRSTGQQTTWLQDRLSYEPINSPGALDNYVNNYHGEIVAETNDWVLMKFPSGGFLKIAKTTSSDARPFLSQQ